MSGKVLGVRGLSVEHRWDGLSEARLDLIIDKDFDTRSLIDASFEYMFPHDVIVKCQHCGQWMAVKTECKKCGAPVDPPRRK